MYSWSRGTLCHRAMVHVPLALNNVIAQPSPQPTAPMTPWIDTLPSELASAIVESNILELLAPFCASFTATFGEAPVFSSSDVSLEDTDHLTHGFARSAFFYSLLSELGMPTVVFCLATAAASKSDADLHLRSRFGLPHQPRFHDTCDNVNCL